MEMERSRRSKEAAGMAYESLVFKKSGHWRTLKMPSAHVALCRAKTRGLRVCRGWPGSVAISPGQPAIIDRVLSQSRGASGLRSSVLSKYVEGVF
jgi:hypothetical protein